MIVIEDLRAMFPAVISSAAGVYLDNASMTQIARSVADRMAEFENQGRANVKRGIYPLATRATDAFESARADIARYLGASSANEIIFTSGATAAINTVAQSFGAPMTSGDEVIIGEGEHHANIVPWQQLRDRSGVILKVLPIDDEGYPRIDALDKLITDRTRLIAVTHCSNVTGAITDISAITKLAGNRDVAVLVDGAQMAAHGPIDVTALGCDFYIVTGHKMFGPTGIGALWGRAEVLDRMPPFMGGGEMIRRVTFDATTYAPPPHRFEAGTPPVTQALGLGAAADWLTGLDWQAVHQHEQQLTCRMLDGLAGVDGLTVLGPNGGLPRGPIVSFVIDGVHPHDICQVMGDAGVALRGGHHCAQPLMERFENDATTRASIALYNNADDVDAFLTNLRRAMDVLR